MPKSTAPDANHADKDNIYQTTWKSMLSRRRSVQDAPGNSLQQLCSDLGLRSNSGKSRIGRIRSMLSQSSVAD